MRKLQNSLIVIGLFCGLAQANLLQDGEFNDPTTFHTGISSVSFDKILFEEWYSANWSYSSSDGNDGGCAVAPISNGWGFYLAQIIQDQGQTQGVHTISFDYAGLVPNDYCKIHVLGIKDGALSQIVLNRTTDPDPDTNNDEDGVVSILSIGDYHRFMITENSPTVYQTKEIELNITQEWDYIGIFVNFYLTRNHTTNIPKIDNIQLTPEPATLGLLAIGSLALLKRRKR